MGRAVLNLFEDDQPKTLSAWLERARTKAPHRRG
jgi:hypothetical protein